MTGRSVNTATIDAHRYDAPNDETCGLLGEREENAPSSWNFSIDVASARERTSNEIATNGLYFSVSTPDPSK